MANNENLIPIPGRLHSVATDGITTGADEIYDDTLQKDQATINSEVQTAIGTGGSVDSRIAAAINALDSEKSQAAGADGLALSITEVDGKITSISGSIAANTYDANGAAATAKTEVIGGATSSGNTLKKLEDRVSPLETAVGSGGSIDTRISNAVAAEAAAREAADTALGGRVDTLEEAVGTGGSVDSRISSAVSAEATRAQAAEADRYTKSETYTKEEVHNLITTPSQEYVSVTATDQTTAVTDVLPATGAADTTYRVGNWDGTQYNDSVFSEYAWNGSAYIKLSTKSQVGEVYDISANHAGTKYADLAAALGTNGANIPQSLQKGGMSVKYVQTSDNKYVQARCMAQSFTTDVTQWQGVDDVPTAGSDNLVKSGGTDRRINYGKEVNYQSVANQYVDSNNGAFVSYAGWSRTEYLYIGPLSKLNYVNDGDYTSQYNAFYDINKQFISSFTLNENSSGSIDVPDNAMWIVISTTTANLPLITISNLPDKLNGIFDIDKKMKVLDTIDEIPLFGSKNFVRSGGIQESLDGIETEIYKEQENFNEISSCFDVVKPANLVNAMTWQIVNNNNGNATYYISSVRVLRDTITLNKVGGGNITVGFKLATFEYNRPIHFHLSSTNLTKISINVGVTASSFGTQLRFEEPDQDGVFDFSINMWQSMDREGYILFYVPWNVNNATISNFSVEYSDVEESKNIKPEYVKDLGIGNISNNFRNKLAANTVDINLVEDYTEFIESTPTYTTLSGLVLNRVDGTNKLRAVLPDNANYSGQFKLILPKERYYRITLTSDYFMKGSTLIGSFYIDSTPSDEGKYIGKYLTFNNDKTVLSGVISTDRELFINLAFAYTAYGVNAEMTVEIECLGASLNSYPTNYRGNEIVSFNKILCIGDSLTLGSLNTSDSQGHYGPNVPYDISKSYPAKLGRLMGGVELITLGDIANHDTGITIVADGGKTSKAWYDLHENDDLSGYEAAIILLGVNDASTEVGGWGGWTQNSIDAFTDIINKLQTENNGIKIFVSTILNAFSYDDGVYNEISQGIRDLVSNLDDEDVILLDLDLYGNLRYSDGYSCGHLSQFGYWRLAQDIYNYISSIMNNNKSDFRKIQFIGTDYDWTKD